MLLTEQECWEPLGKAREGSACDSGATANIMPQVGSQKWPDTWEFERGRRIYFGRVTLDV